jgi:hypothetical protein
MAVLAERGITLDADLVTRLALAKAPTIVDKKTAKRYSLEEQSIPYDADEVANLLSEIQTAEEETLTNGGMVIIGIKGGQVTQMKLETETSRMVKSPDGNDLLAIFRDKGLDTINPVTLNFRFGDTLKIQPGTLGANWREKYPELVEALTK